MTRYLFCLMMVLAVLLPTAALADPVAGTYFKEDFGFKTGVDPFPNLSGIGVAPGWGTDATFTMLSTVEGEADGSMWQIDVTRGAQLADTQIVFNGNATNVQAWDVTAVVTLAAAGPWYGEARDGYTVNVAGTLYKEIGGWGRGAYDLTGSFDDPQFTLIARGAFIGATKVTDMGSTSDDPTYVLHFKIKGNKPEVTLADVSGIGVSSITLNGAVNPNGHETTYEFAYGKTTDYGSTAPVSARSASAGAGVDSVAVSVDLAGLDAETTYHYQLSATNSYGTVTSPDATFTTVSTNAWKSVRLLLEHAVTSGAFPDGLALDIFNQNDAKVFSWQFGDYDQDTIMSVASASKWMSSGTICALITAIRATNPAINFGLDSTTGEWLKDRTGQPWVGDKANITLRQLLSMTAGIPNGGLDYFNDVNIDLEEAVLQFYEDNSFTLDPPGSVFNYGGTYWYLAGQMAVEAYKQWKAADGEELKWHDLFREIMADPLGFDEDARYWPLTSETEGGDNPSLGGGLSINMVDYGRYLKMFTNFGIYNGTQIISGDLVGEMMSDQFTPTTTIKGSPFANEGYHYGLGCWREYERNAARNEGDLIIASMGAYGFYPLYNTIRRFYGVQGMKRAQGTRPSLVLWDTIAKYVSAGVASGEISIQPTDEGSTSSEFMDVNCFIQSLARSSSARPAAAGLLLLALAGLGLAVSRRRS